MYRLRIDLLCSSADSAREDLVFRAEISITERLHERSMDTRLCFTCFFDHICDLSAGIEGFKEQVLLYLVLHLLSKDMCSLLSTAHAICQSREISSDWLRVKTLWVTSQPLTLNYSFLKSNHLNRQS